MLEPYAVKVACTVLGRGRASNRSFLFDYAVKVASTVLKRGSRRRGILIDIGCMGISCAANFIKKINKIMI